MKSPRELLLNRHRAVTPRLDAIRERVLDEELSGAVDLPTGRATFWQTVWVELVWRGRRAWTAIAAAWVLILGLQWVAMNEGDENSAKPSFATEVDVKAWVERREMTADLLGEENPYVGERKRSPSDEEADAKLQRIEVV